MGKQILNRREKIVTENIPPVIPNVSGFLTATDYATASKGGVVKVGTTGGLQVSSGTLKGKTLADATAYAEAGDDVVMTKGDMAYIPTGGGMPTFTQLFSGDADFGTANTTATLTADYDTFDAIYCIFQNAVSKNISPFFMWTQFIPEPSETGTNHVVSTGVSSSASNGIAEGAFWFTDKRTMKCGPSGPSVHLITVYGVTF